MEQKVLKIYRKDSQLLHVSKEEKPVCHFIVSRIPFPPIGGDKLKYFNMVKMLRHRYKIHAVIITDEVITPEMKTFLQENVDEYKIFCYSKFRFRLNALKALFSSLPLQVGYYYFSEIHTYCIRSIKPQDIIMANLIRTALYVEDLPNIKLIDIADSIYLNYIRSVDRVGSFFWKMIYNIEIKRLHQFEKKCVNKFDASLFANLTEKNYYANCGNATWIPNGVNLDLIRKQFTKTKKTLYPEVVFFGKMDYQPNIDALKWFIDKILPLVVDLQIRVIGGSPLPSIKALEKKYPRSVKIEGFIEDPYQIMYNATAVVAPMQTGGGIQNKILEAMAIGAIVLTTTLGAKAIIGANNGKHLIICDEPEEYSAAIYALYRRQKEIRLIGNNAKKLIKESFTWDLYSQKLYDVIDKVSCLKSKKIINVSK